MRSNAMSGLARPAADAAVAARAGKVISEADIADYFWPRDLGGQSRSDLAFHSVRWAHLLAQVDRLVERLPDADAARILDIGVSLQTELLKHNYPGAVDTLDIDEDNVQRAEGEQHRLLDLNELYYRERTPALGPYDVIVMCEVIEHLYTPSVNVLAGVASWLAPGGYLFIQTPNAVALHKRLKALAGYNPYMDLSAGTRTSPPHFREYTKAELISAGHNAGLEVLNVDARNYFTGRRPGTQAYNWLCERLPPTLRAGLSVTYRRTVDADAA
jgi:2-polyprenyl-3-methyl-5-hydroxy-6-metoxy-1,4-benzoquinol methylase